MEKSIRIVHSQDEIGKRVNSLSEEIRMCVVPDNLTVVGILDDSFVFFADLIRALNLPVNCSFMKVTRQQHGEQTDILYISEFEPKGRDILLVGGVVSTGITLDYLVKHLEDRDVKSLRTCMLVDKPAERHLDVKLDFTAFQTEEGYLFGYGLGLENEHRHLPYLAMMEA
jgi:hypoxanthine phosphoribosyltransferase